MTRFIGAAVIALIAAIGIGTVLACIFDRRIRRAWLKFWMERL